MIRGMMRGISASMARVTAARTSSAGTTAADHIYLIDPRSNLMMRFPKDADPNKVKTDLSKLLRASAIG